METNAKINLTMQITQGTDDSKTEYATDANFQEKDGKFYLFFNEENYDDGEVTKCRFELDENLLRMRRNGSIVLEQTHIRRQKTDGYIKTPYGRVETRVRTFQLSFVERADKSYLLKLGYDLYTDDSDKKTGTYLLEIVIKQEARRLK